MDDLAKDTELIRSLVRFCNLAPATLAKRAGVAPSTINRPYNGTSTTRLGRQALEKLQATFPDFPGWAGATSLSDDRLPFRGFPTERDPDLVEVAEIDPSFGMGAVMMDEHATPNMRKFSRAWLKQFTDAQPEDLYWARGRGNSMEPDIRDGEPVLIDRRQQTPRDADLIWAFAWGDIGAIKRLRPMPDGSVKILSNNASVAPDVAYDGELHVFGRVISVVRKL